MLFIWVAGLASVVGYSSAVGRFGTTDSFGRNNLGQNWFGGNYYGYGRGGYSPGGGFGGDKQLERNGFSGGGFKSYVSGYRNNFMGNFAAGNKGSTECGRDKFSKREFRRHVCSLLSQILNHIGLTKIPAKLNPCANSQHIYFPTIPQSLYSPAVPNVVNKPPTDNSAPSLEGQWSPIDTYGPPKKEYGGPSFGSLSSVNSPMYTLLNNNNYGIPLFESTRFKQEVSNEQKNPVTYVSDERLPEKFNINYPYNFDKEYKTTAHHHIKVYPYKPEEIPSVPYNSGQYINSSNSPTNKTQNYQTEVTPVEQSHPLINLQQFSSKDNKTNDSNSVTNDEKEFLEQNYVSFNDVRINKQNDEHLVQ